MLLLQQIVRKSPLLKFFQSFFIFKKKFIAVGIKDARLLALLTMITCSVIQNHWMTAFC